MGPGQRAPFGSASGGRRNPIGSRLTLRASARAVAESCARSPARRDSGSSPRNYQAWVRVQWGQPTDVVTSASKAYPHSHVYRARSSEGPPWRRSRGEPSGSGPAAGRSTLCPLSGGGALGPRSRQEARCSRCLDLTSICLYLITLNGVNGFSLVRRVLHPANTTLIGSLPQAVSGGGLATARMGESDQWIPAVSAPSGSRSP